MTENHLMDDQELFYEPQEIFENDTPIHRGRISHSSNSLHDLSDAGSNNIDREDFLTLWTFSPGTVEERRTRFLEKFGPNEHRKILPQPNRLKNKLPPRSPSPTNDALNTANGISPHVETYKWYEKVIRNSSEQISDTIQSSKDHILPGASPTTKEPSEPSTSTSTSPYLVNLEQIRSEPSILDVPEIQTQELFRPWPRRTPRYKTQNTKSEPGTPASSCSPSVRNRNIDSKGLSEPANEWATSSLELDVKSMKSSGNKSEEYLSGSVKGSIKYFSDNLQGPSLIDTPSRRASKLMKGNQQGKRRKWLKLLGLSRSFDVERNKSDRAKRNGEISSLEIVSSKGQGNHISGISLIQETKAHRGAIWALVFSADGSWLATGGMDGTVRVWEVGKEQSDVEKVTFGKVKWRGDREIGGGKFHLRTKAFRCLKGHSGGITCLAFSKGLNSSLLLSASDDCTVRLWDLGSEDCLRVFHHAGSVTSVSFSPGEDRRFVSSSLDSKLRLWSVPEREVLDWVEMSHGATAVAYLDRGQKLAVGLSNGVCRFFSTQEDKLTSLDQCMEVRSAKVGKGHGKRITFIQPIGEEGSQFLVTSNDSRIRHFDGTETLQKYKGHKFESSFSSASLDPSGRFMVCASEDNKLVFWPFLPPKSSLASPLFHRKPSFQYVETNPVTGAKFWPGFNIQSKSEKVEGQQKTENSRFSWKVGEATCKKLNDELIVVTAGADGYVRVYNIIDR